MTTTAPSADLGSAPPTLSRLALIALACGCLIAILTFGVRTSMGLFNSEISASHGWGREVFALAMAIQNLLWGLGQPFAGAIADRYGTARVLAAGGALYAAGVALMAISDTPFAFYMSAGVMVGFGLSGASFTLVIAAFGRIVAPERRGWAMGIATASGSLGQFIFAPVGQAFIDGYGWSGALLLLSVFVAIVPLLAMALSGKRSAAQLAGEPPMKMRLALSLAFRHPSYQLLVAGFFVCGFHIALITTHFPPYLKEAGISASTASWALGLIGLFNVIGSYAAGVMSGTHSKRWMLSLIYLARAALISAFLLLPLTPVTAIGFAAIIGLLWLSTVPPTSGLVVTMFGTRYMATLFGVVFFSHQVGAFLGAWLGGYLYDRTGSYDVVWWLGVALGLFAALVHLPISERSAPEFAAITPAAAAKAAS